MKQTKVAVTGTPLRGAATVTPPPPAPSGAAATATPPTPARTPAPTHPLGSWINKCSVSCIEMKLPALLGNYNWPKDRQIDGPSKQPTDGPESS